MAPIDHRSLDRGSPKHSLHRKIEGGIDLFGYARMVVHRLSYAILDSKMRQRVRRNGGCPATRCLNYGLWIATRYDELTGCQIGEHCVDKLSSFRVHN